MELILSLKGLGLDSRLNWDELFMAKAILLGKTRSVCKYYKVGTIIARGEQILSFGYNGPARGEDHCSVVGCAKEVNGVRLPPGTTLCRGSHAEINAISNAANMGMNIESSTFYITYRPCYGCAKQLVNAKIERIVYYEDYDGEPQAIELLRRRRIQLVKFCNISQVKIDFNIVSREDGK